MNYIMYDEIYIYWWNENKIKKCENWINDQIKRNAGFEYFWSRDKVISGSFSYTYLIKWKSDKCYTYLIKWKSDKCYTYLIKWQSDKC